MSWTSFIPAGILTAGAIAIFAVGHPVPVPLTHPLDSAVPDTLLGFPGRTVPLGSDEVRVSAVTAYLNRDYDVGDTLGPVTLYVGYHATQGGEQRMHLPSMCLPGAGWTPVSASQAPIPMGDTVIPVNRFVLQQGKFRILVYYWFQGRGRVTSGETAFRLRAVRDAILSHRDEEALVRVVVPIPATGAAVPVGTTGLLPDSLATRFAAATIPLLQRALPPAP